MFDLESDIFRHLNLDGLELESSTIPFVSPNCLSLNKMQTNFNFFEILVETLEGVKENLVVPGNPG